MAAVLVLASRVTVAPATMLCAAPALATGGADGAVVKLITVCLMASAVWLLAKAVVTVPSCAVVSLSLSASSSLSCASPLVGLPWVATTRGVVMKLPMPVVSMVPVKTRPMAVCAAVMLAVVTFCVAAAASKAAKKTFGSLPKTRAVVISVKRVMLATAVLPLPDTSVCSLVPSAGLVTCKTQGS